jgi:RNA polymerase subunit RPABC4/transcription elongation factor Spt4
MALVACKECKNQVSTKAASCPVCGAPLSKQISGEAIGFLLIVGGMLIALATEPPVDTWAKVAAFTGVVVFIMGRMR